MSDFTTKGRNRLYKDRGTGQPILFAGGWPLSSDGFRVNFRRMGLQGSIKGQHDCIREFSEINYPQDPRRIDRPTLIIHGDDDQIVPIKASARLAAKIVQDATAKIYPGGSHGLAEINPERSNSDVLGFIRS